jgi:hypothetical protein
MMVPIFTIAVFVVFLFVMFTEVALPQGNEEENYIRLSIVVIDDVSKKEVCGAVIDLYSKEKPKKFPMMTSKTSKEGSACFKVAPGKVVVQVNAKGHDPYTTDYNVNKKDASQSVKIVLEKRKSADPPP